MMEKLSSNVILFNLMFNVIPIFFLFYLKMFVQVWATIVKLRKRFLWGGVKGVSKISWIKWKDVCKSKDSGGLRVRVL